MIWSFFDSGTGEILKRRFSGTEKAARRNTPPGATLILGRYDRRSQRVDVATGEVIDYQPTQPDADHEWNEQIRRWVKRADVVARERQDEAARKRIVELESSQQRAIREHLLGDPTAIDRLRAIDDEIVSLRPQIISRG